MADGPGERDEKAEASGDPLRLVLHTMEEQLDDRVDAVSDRGPSHDESTSDLIRLEETLSSAQDKAKQLVTLRLKLDEEATGSDGGGAAAERAAASAKRPDTGSRGDDAGSPAAPSDAAPPDATTHATGPDPSR